MARGLETRTHGGHTMTATIARPGRSGRRTYPAVDYVECPVCHVPTGDMAWHGRYGFRTDLYPNASGPADGARCKDHARTEELRAAQTRQALAWIAQDTVEAQLVHE